MKQSRVYLQLLVLLFSALLFAGCSSGPAKESTGEYIDSSAITAKVKTALIKEKDLKAFSIEVDTFKGVVQLSGFVNTEEQVVRAGNVARSVQGVKSVSNDLIVKSRIN